MKSYELWTRKELEALPLRGWGEDIGEFESLIILPTKRIHDSGFRQMDFVSVKDNIPTYRLSGCSDVIHINGFRGLGGCLNTSQLPIEWNIDCLKVSGLLRLFGHNQLKAGPALSSFEIFNTK